jgi:SAM-dependent methyltransferase
VNLFATALPGFGPLVLREIAATPGLRARAGNGFDGRNDVIPFSGRGDRRLLAFHTAEDLFAEIASLDEPSGASEVSDAVASEGAMDGALAAWVTFNGPVARPATYRLVVRLRAEQRFRRPALRDHVLAGLGQVRSGWQVADPAQLEFWCLEDRPGALRIGLRLTADTAHMRAMERPGALRPSAAAAMVVLAGEASGRLLDPCCGSGTILVEAITRGWIPVGVDIDPEAVTAARANAGQHALIVRGDARALPFGDGVFAAAVSNLPFGRAQRVDGDPATWLTSFLESICRVTEPRAPLVVMVPDSRAWQSALAAHPALAAEERYPVTVLGQRTFLWRLQRS